MKEDLKDLDQSPALPWFVQVEAIPLRLKL